MDTPSGLTRQEKRMLLAKKLKQKLLENNMNGVRFANKIGKQPSEISKWLSGNHNFTLDTLLDIEESLNITLIDVDDPSRVLLNRPKSFVLSKPRKTAKNRLSIMDNLSNNKDVHLGHSPGFVTETFKFVANPN